MLRCCVRVKQRFSEKAKGSGEKALATNTNIVFFRNEGRKHFLMFTSINYKKILSELKRKHT